MGQKVEIQQVTYVISNNGAKILQLDSYKVKVQNEIMTL